MTIAILAAPDAVALLIEKLVYFAKFPVLIHKNLTISLGEILNSSLSCSKWTSGVSRQSVEV